MSFQQRDDADQGPASAKKSLARGNTGVSGFGGICSETAARCFEKGSQCSLARKMKEIRRPGPAVRAVRLKR